MRFRSEVIFSTYSEAVRVSSSGKVFDIKNNEIYVDEEQIQAKIAELTAVEPLRQLRIQRNQLLAQTDWRMTTDYPYADQAEWASYRTQLRNLPATSSPTLDEQGNLIVDWPQAPSDL